MSDLQNQLNNLSNIDLTKILNYASLVVENEAKRLCPVGDGLLRNSITHEVRGNEGIIGTNTYYSPYAELGTGLFAVQGNGRQDRWSYQTPDGEWHSTVGQQPQPFLQPALANTRDDVRQTIIDKIKEELRNNA